MNKDPLKTAGAVVVLVALVWGAFGGALRCGFVHFDDDQYVFDNAAIADGWSWNGVRWAFTTGHAANWHPVTWLSHMTDIELFGMNPRAHHAVNIWIHALNAVLLFGVLRRLTGRFGLAWWVAALWCVHPLRAESVVWVSERKDVLAMLFGLLALGAYASSGSRGKMGWVSLFFALSLMSKPMWITLPFLLLLLDVWPFGRWKTGNVWELFRGKWPLFLLAIVSGVVTFIVQKRGGAVGSLDLLSPGVRLANALVAYAEYLRLLFWPAGLSVLYPYPEAGHSILRVGISLALLLGVTVVAVSRWRRRSWLAVGWLWFLGTLVPMIGLVQVGRQSWADRYTYLPHIGLLVALAWALDEMGRGGSVRRSGAKWILGLAATTVVATWTGFSRRQTAVWQTNETLFLHAIAVTDNNLLAHGNLGTWYGMQGQWDKAEYHLNEVLRRRPMDGGARHSLGNVYIRQERKDEALAEYRLAAQDNKQWEAMNNVAWLLATAPDGAEHAGESLDWAERALRAAPESGLASVWNTLAASRANAGDFPGAIEAAEKSLELARASGDFALAERVRSRMKLFERRQPYRE